MSHKSQAENTYDQDMDSFASFIVSSIVVLAALTLSLGFWIAIRRQSRGQARLGATLFSICFALYVIGQSTALLQGLRVLNGWWMVPSLTYAAAAILFAIGSYCLFKAKA